MIQDDTIARLLDVKLYATIPSPFISDVYSLQCRDNRAQRQLRFGVKAEP